MRIGSGYCQPFLVDCALTLRDSHSQNHHQSLPPLQVNRLDTLDPPNKFSHLVDLDATLGHTAEVDALADTAVLALPRVSVPALCLAVDRVPVGQVYGVGGVAHGDVVEEEGVVAVVPVLAV